VDDRGSDGTGCFRIHVRRLHGAIREYMIYIMRIAGL